jgi:peptidoglycan/LPS O-acetylase OafA/YrhL
MNTLLSISKTDVLPEVKAKPRAHLGVLDLLRGFAALSVCLYHFSGGALPKFYTPELEGYFTWGYMGVEVFFVISGFIIPYSLYGTGYQIRDFGGYFLKRVARICPPAYIGMFLSIGQLLLVHYFLHHNQQQISNMTVGQMVSNIFFIVPFTNYHWFNEVFWTLAIEFQFYVVIGLLFDKLFIRANLISFLAIGLLMSAGYYVLNLMGFKAENYLHFSAFFMMGGACLLYLKGVFNNLEFAAALLVFGAVALAIFPPAVMLFGIVTALIIVFLKVQHSWFAFFGKISYSLYLTHSMVGAYAEFTLSHFYHPATVAGKVFGVFLCVVAAIIAAYMFFLLVENPFIKLAKRVIGSGKQVQPAVKVS